MEANAHLRITVFESERMMRDLLLETLSHGGVQVLQTHGESTTFLASLATDRPDVALADLHLDLGEEQALSVVREAKEKHPGIPLVVLSSHARPDAESCYRQGAAAWLDITTASSEELIRAVREVAGGVRLFPFSLAPSGLHPAPAPPASPLLNRLSLRERQVLTFIGEGADNLKISALLGISERTVKSHVTNLYRKTSAENRTQLAILARELGLRPPQQVLTSAG